MNIQYNVSSDKKVIESFCNEAEKYQLHLGSAGLMERWQISPSLVGIMSIAYDNDIPIGCCMILDCDQEYTIGVYVAPSYRHKGIGTQLSVLALKESENDRRVKIKAYPYENRKRFFSKLHKHTSRKIFYPF